MCGSRFGSRQVVFVCWNRGERLPTFVHHSYTQTTSIKVDAMNLIDMATEDYQSHQKEVLAVQSSIQKIYEYEKHRPKNEITVKQWEILTDSSRILGRFITKWKTEKTLGKVYIEDKKKNIAFVFDQIAGFYSPKVGNKLNAAKTF